VAARTFLPLFFWFPLSLVAYRLFSLSPLPRLFFFLKSCYPLWVVAWYVVVWNSLRMSALAVIRQASWIEKKKWKEIMLASDG